MRRKRKREGSKAGVDPPSEEKGSSHIEGREAATAWRQSTNTTGRGGRGGLAAGSVSPPSLSPVPSPSPAPPSSRLDSRGQGQGPLVTTENLTSNNAAASSDTGQDTNFSDWFVNPLGSLGPQDLEFFSFSDEGGVTDEGHIHEREGAMAALQSTGGMEVEADHPTGDSDAKRRYTNRPAIQIALTEVERYFDRETEPERFNIPIWVTKKSKCQSCKTVRLPYGINSFYNKVRKAYSKTCCQCLASKATAATTKKVVRDREAGSVCTSNSDDSRMTGTSHDGECTGRGSPRQQRTMSRRTPAEEAVAAPPRTYSLVLPSIAYAGSPTVPGAPLCSVTAAVPASSSEVPSVSVTRE